MTDSRWLFLWGARGVPGGQQVVPPLMTQQVFGAGQFAVPPGHAQMPEEQVAFVAQALPQVPQLVVVVRLVQVLEQQPVPLARQQGWVL